MDANKRNLSSVFGQTVSYVVPLFQRPYVWEEENRWVPFWESVQQVAEQQLANEARPHFLGAIVLDQLRTPTGNVLSRQIIDGQQRLTSLQLIIAAARDLAHALGATDHEHAFEGLTTNTVPLSTGPRDELKVWPTNVDRDYFTATMAARSPDHLAQALNKDGDNLIAHRIPRAYLFFFDQLRKWVSEDGEAGIPARIDAVFWTFQNHLLMVVIDLDENDDPQVIFETLNALGTPLLPADLVKNFLFHSAEAEGWPIEDMYAEYWKKFDDETDFWRAEIRQGRLKRPRVDLFLQHYLTLERRKEVVVSHLFDTFRRHVRSTPSKTAGDFLAAVSDYASVYRRFHHYERSTICGDFFYRLGVLDQSTLFPLLLELFKRQGLQESVADRDAALRDLESFIVRRMICRLTTKNYNRLFLDLVQALSSADDFSAQAVRDFLLRQDADSTRWPDDDEFRRAWLTNRVYGYIAQSRVRLILSVLDLAMYDGKTEKTVWDGDLTLEHLMPQSWEEHWPLPGDHGDEYEARNRRESLLHTFGNLTLLTSKLNPSVSNGPWRQKKGEILKHSSLNLNRRLADYDDWTEDAIERRGEKLFNVAREEWSRP